MKDSTLKSKDSRYAWLMLAVIFLVSLAAPLNQFKVPPMIQQLSTSLGVTLGEAGWLMSVFSIVAIFMALPAGFIIRRIGIRRAGTLAMLAFIGGSLMGGLAESPGLLLLSRVLEGVGMCLTAIMAPAALSYWFTSAKLGSAMGIWGTWVPLGVVIMFNLAPQIGAESWRVVWLFGTAYSVFALILFIAAFRLPKNKKEIVQETPPQSLISKIKVRDIWLLALAFAAQNVTQITLNTFMPAFLETEKGMTGAAASFITSLLMLISMASGALGGVWSDRIHSRKKFIAWPLLFMAGLMILPFSIPAGWSAPFMLSMGILVGFIPTCVFAAAPEIMKDPKDAGIGLAVVAFGQNLGMFFGPGFYGMCIEHVGWTTSGYLVIPVLLVGFIAAMLIRIR